MCLNSHGRDYSKIAVLVRYAGLAASDANAVDYSAETLRTGIKQYKQMSFPLLERAQLWKSFPSALDQAPQGQHSFSASWSTNQCCLAQHTFCNRLGASTYCTVTATFSSSNLQPFRCLIWRYRTLYCYRTIYYKYFLCLKNITVLQFWMETVFTKNLLSVSKQKA